MIRWRKVGTVASFEFLSEVKRISFLIATFGMPVFVLAYGGFVSLIGRTAQRSESSARIYGIVDTAGLLALDGDATPPSEVPEKLRATLDEAARASPVGAPPVFFENIVFRRFADGKAAVEAVKARSIRGVFVLPESYLATGNVEATYAEWAGLGTKRVERALRGLLQERLLAGKVSDELASRVRNPLEHVEARTLNAHGELVPRSMVATIARFAVPLVFAMLLFISVFGTAMSLIQGTAVEKENRVVEVLLSSASPDEILLGKLLGLGASGLLQIAVWFSMAGLGALVFATALSAAGVEIAWGAIGAGVVFFVAGYLFLGSLMLGTGSLGANAKEGQQWSLVWTLMTTLPMVFIGVLFEEPHGTTARLLTWIPFSSPTIVVFRLSIDPAGIAWWEVVGAFLVLVACIWFAIRVGARLFRIGLLMTGSRITLKDVVRQARL